MLWFHVDYQFVINFILRRAVSYFDLARQISDFIIGGYIILVFIINPDPFNLCLAFANPLPASRNLSFIELSVNKSVIFIYYL